ncbi:MAG: FecCD family ABC transporter permease [Candidatus Bipolaricaulia bacterium]
MRHTGWLSVAVLIGIALSLFVGRYPQPYVLSPATLSTDIVAQKVVVQLRLPRVLMGALLGMTLATAGLVLQMIFRNPLVEPGFLGVSQGAAFGAAFSIIFLKGSPLVIELMATAFALLGLLGSFVLARSVRFGDWNLRLILAGIIVSAFLAAGVGLLKYLADPLRELQEITFWLLGGLWGVSWEDFVYVLPFVVPGVSLAYFMRWRLNLLSLEDETAFSLGVETTRERALVLIAVVAAVAALVSVAGLVGWIGLITPHLARRLVGGAEAHRALPVSLLLGGLVTVGCDTLARTLIAGEIPLGILTSFFGAAGFASLMRWRV